MGVWTVVVVAVWFLCFFLSSFSSSPFLLLGSGHFTSVFLFSLSFPTPCSLSHQLVPWHWRITLALMNVFFFFFFPWFAWWNEGEERKGGSGLAGEVVFIMVGRMVESWLENKCLVGNGKVGQVRSGQVRSGSRFFVGIE
jgi:hypothetical protein